MIPKLASYLASCTPCIFLPTVEDAKAERHVVETLIDNGFLDRELCIWKVTSGMLKYGKGNWTKTLVPTNDRPIMEFIGALNYVAGNERTIGIFYHVRGLLKDATVIQSIIDAAYQAKGKFSAIIFIGAFLDLPPELYNIITFCDFPLPTKEELEALCERLMKAWEQKTEFPKSKKKRKEIFSKSANSALGLDLFSAENAMALAVSMTGEFNSKIIQSQKEQHVKKSEVLEYVKTEIGLEDVGGFGALKKWLDRRKEAFSDKAREYGLPWPKGILLVGLPGVGKSHCSKAIASLLELPLLRLDIGGVFKRYVGESEENIRRALNIVEAVSPVILWVDEIDKAMAGMESSGKSDSGITARVLTTLLTWRQETTHPVFMVCTANDPGMMPSMVYRKGRLDEVWAVELPTLQERKEIFRIHLKKRNRNPDDFNLDLLGSKTVNFSGSEIEAAIEDAMFYSFYEDTELHTNHILTAVEETIPQNNTDSEDTLRIKEWMKQRARAVAEPEENELIESEHKPVRSLSDLIKSRNKE